MKDKVLKLCRRLKSCTLSDLSAFIEIDEKIIETILLYLEQEGLIQNQNGLITIAETKKKKSDINNKNLHLMFQYRTDEEIDILLKGFCLEIPPQKLCKFLNIQYQCVCDYYCLFRKNIYNRQFKNLINLFMEKTQIGRYRTFYNKFAFFYIYNNQVFVSEKLLRASLEKNYNKDEIREFKRMYCYLSRIESHNINQNFMYYRLAEYIWRREKDFDYLYDDLKNNLIY